VKPVRIIGVGSPAGDDQAGWWVIEALEGCGLRTQVWAQWVCSMTLDRPGAGLIPCLQGARRVFLIDAVQSAAVPGTVYRLGIGDLARYPGTLSSHGVGVASALDLARELGMLPAELALYGIGIGSGAPGTPSSPLVREAAHAVAREIVAALENGLARDAARAAGR
jgi:hydrogenase maturation protease